MKSRSGALPEAAVDESGDVRRGVIPAEGPRRLDPGRAVLAKALAIVRVVVPAPADRAPVRLEQHVVAAPHPPVEALEEQALAPLGEAVELLLAAQEVAVWPDVERAGLAAQRPA
jgi:hypothetical protein